MTTWHYQVMRHNAGKKHEYYAIHEYYEGEQGEGYTMRPIEISGMSVDEIKDMLKKIENDIYQHGIKDYYKTPEAVDEDF
jgi:hypothetical protein